MFAVDVTDAHQFDRLSFDLQLRQPFDVSSESTPSRADESDSNLAVGVGAFSRPVCLGDGGGGPDRGGRLDEAAAAGFFSVHEIEDS